MRSAAMRWRITYYACAAWCLMLLFFSPGTIPSVQRMLNGSRVRLAPFAIGALTVPTLPAIRTMEELPSVATSTAFLQASDWASKDWNDPTHATELTALLYDVERTVAHSTIPPKMRQKLLDNGRDPVKFQTQESITVASRYIPSEALSFNRVRAQRFTGAPATAPASRAVRRTTPASAAEVDAEVGGARLGELAATLDLQRCQVRTVP